ncbi:MAG: type IIL restriction-modification enzyme MmeI [Halofilum sp. (in: g-proteobacteria)]|nr:type IIL restriction-modification enzyme MmeI [Halofilum sp. (in: g-proteobacteria)]
MAEEPFDPEGFPFAFLEAFGNKATTIKRLRSGASNKSDIDGVLQTGNIHIKVCAEGQVPKQSANCARARPRGNARNRVKFILATDGVTLEAEDLVSDVPPIACDYPDFPEHFAFFASLAGISFPERIKDNDFDVRATGRLNKLYIELLRENPDWGRPSVATT